MPLPGTEAPDLVSKGMASWYGPGFEGRRTASGERFDGRRFTAAHRNLPFGTWVEVRNLDNGRSVAVRINDRGPFVRRRVIDLSRAAAAELGMLGPGTAKVAVYRLAEPPPDAWMPPATGPLTVQVGAFHEGERARTLAETLAKSFGAVTIDADGTWHRVRVGRFTSADEAEDIRRRLTEKGYSAIVVPVIGEGEVSPTPGSAEPPLGFVPLLLRPMAL
ncbi:MAG TPA: septal ring lytic transglycosylase RlpA family protein [Thermoanaerobaculia bacterium]|nr:septal ring lytic transglycosylase RlpA family protein [Thermoanaerobaculia bacterium]